MNHAAQAGEALADILIATQFNGILEDTEDDDEEEEVVENQKNPEIGREAELRGCLGGLHSEVESSIANFTPQGVGRDNYYDSNYRGKSTDSVKGSSTGSTDAWVLSNTDSGSESGIVNIGRNRSTMMT